MTSCIGCRFYDRDEGASSEGGGLRWGRCRRSVPTLHLVPGRGFSGEGVWPRVRDDDWCGAWAAREKCAEPPPAHADSLLAAAGVGGDDSMRSVASSGPHESLMVPPDLVRAPQPSPNHFASD